MLSFTSIVGSRKTLPAILRPLPSPIKDPAEAQKVNMGTIKSTWALDVLGVGLKMQRAVQSALTMFGCRSGEKLLKCGLCIAITVVTITRQCHEAAAGKRASRSAQFKLKMRSCEEVRPRVYPTLRAVSTVQRPNGAEFFLRPSPFRVPQCHPSRRRRLVSNDIEVGSLVRLAFGSNLGKNKAT